MPKSRWKIVILTAFVIHPAISAVTNLDRIRRGLNPPGLEGYDDDTCHYLGISLKLLAGRLPYRDFVVEYPPLSLPLLVAPALITRSLWPYRLWFALEMLALNATGVVVFARWIERRLGADRIPSGLIWYTIFYIFMSRLVVCRFDPAPAVVAFAAATAWVSGRDGQGGTLAALGALVKYYPALVAGPAGLDELVRWRRSHLRGVIVFAVVLGSGLLMWAAIGSPRGIAESLRYQTERGLEWGKLVLGAADARGQAH